LYIEKQEKEKEKKEEEEQKSETNYSMIFISLFNYIPLEKTNELKNDLSNRKRKILISVILKKE